MFDPTIFDNLKVVLEGCLYDQDAEGEIAVTRREDLLDLAGMGRTFRMEIRLPGSSVSAVVQLSSALPDFAAELRGIRLAGQRPGAELEIVYGMPGNASDDLAEAMIERMANLWGSEDADLSHERIQRYGGGSEPNRTLRFTVRFRHKMDESHMEELGPLAEHLVASLKTIEEALK
ncbi:hypothetical protein ACFQI7_15230 [Paenibacillus allorhizosphaerae]|uniref:FDX-ACB domain-containing protein n=1 Tax=Paenibacillus allorhizosphaerae TaxID=2849866 RepID=A0ABM8VDN4_9BACL|nr:hypothetical protein [Paenibacillus allorhizosphaerae]CAG7628149.1 hypothetical protein PAECIP111802_01427 [Paenibacillus allorhizosphaerae]